MPDPSPRTDPLTGLSTPQHFEIISDFAFSLAARGVSMSVVALALDVPDEGASTDAVTVAEGVRNLARIVRTSIRDTDVACVDDVRIQCLLVDCNLQGGLVFADRIRALAERDLPRTVSAGVASYFEGMDGSADVLRGATAALGTARREGGDTVRLHRPGSEGED